MKLHTKNLVTAAMLLALAIILPTVVHISGINGAIFLPMHIPVLITGLIVGPSWGFVVGIISPIINHVITGMPPVPVFWVMIVELGLYGLISGILYRKIKMTLWPSLILSMIVGRLGAALMVLILGKGFGFPMPPINVYIKGMTLTALPGIIIQLIFIPMIVKACEKDKNTMW